MTTKTKPKNYHPLADACEIRRHSSRKRWLLARRESLGASEAYDALDEPLPVWERKTRGEEANPIPETPQMRWGKILEDPIRAEAKAALGVPVYHRSKYEVCHHADRPWQSATLDGTIVDVSPSIRQLFDEWSLPDPEGECGVLEIKTAGPFTARQWAHNRDGENPWPLRYQVQVQHQLQVTGCRWGVVAALIMGQDFRLIPFARHDRFADTMLEGESRFWEHVEANTPPPPQPTIASAKALARIHPDDNGETVLLGSEWLDVHADLVEIKQQQEELKTARLDLENRIKAEIGDATYGELPDGTVYKWQTEERREYTVKASKFRKLYAPRIRKAAD